jgi:two-component system cell cycle sensor histidine kinase/response regulator CckA
MTFDHSATPFPTRRPYAWLPALIISMTFVAIVIGTLVLHYVEDRLVTAAGQNLTLVAAEITDKLDRLMFERYGDSLIMANAFGEHMDDVTYLRDFLLLMKQAYAPFYVWLGVLDADGRVLAATDSDIHGRNWSRQQWFQAVRDTKLRHIGDVGPYEAVQGSEAVAFSAPIIGKNGAFLGVVTARISVLTIEDVLTQTLRAIESRSGSPGPFEYQFMARDGRVFIDSDLEHKGGVNLRWLGLPSALLSASGQPGYVEEEHVRRHLPVVTGYASTHGYGEAKGFEWTVLLRMDQSHILAPVRLVLLNIGMAGAAVWVPMFIALFWTTRRLRHEWAQTQQETARARAAEAAERHSEARTRLIIETALDAVIVMDAHGRVTDWNAQAQTMFGWSRDEAIGELLSSMIIPVALREAHNSGLDRFLTTGEGSVLNKRVELTARHRDGHEFPVELSVSPAKMGDVYTFSAFVRDVTEQKRAETQLRDSEERYRSVVTALDEGVLLVDDRGLVQACNASAERILGVAPGSLLKQRVHDPNWQVIHEDGSPFPRDERPVLVTLGTGQACADVIMGVRIGEGGLRWLSVHTQPLIRPGAAAPHAVVASFTDITDQKRIEQRLRVQHAITRVLAEATTLKEAAAVILETICEPLGWNLGILWIVDRPANVLRCMDSWAQANTEVETFDAASRQRTFSRGIGLPGRVWSAGVPTWIVDILHDTNFPRFPMAERVGLHAAAAFPILLGGEVEGVLEFFSREVRQPDDHILALMAGIGSQVGHLIERKQLEEQLRQSQKMEAIGRLAGGIAHDFNNLLTVITGYSEVAMSRLREGDPLRMEIAEIKQAGHRAAALTSQLLAFSRRQVLQPKVLDLNVVVMNLEKLLHRLIGEDVNLVVSLAPVLGHIHVDPGQIEQVLMNLSVNARDAMPRGGKLVIETQNVDFIGSAVGRPLSMHPGSYVMLVVSDTGCGMDDYTRSHIFEPFFTTKEHGKGTGLGLSTVYGIVKQANGEILVDSKPDQGTTFTIYFPRVADRSSSASEAGAQSSMTHSGTETLLLVEDEPAIRALAGDILRRTGYKVLEARHGVEALLTGSQYLGTIHLLITDVIMPQMSGGEVAERLIHNRPDMKVLYISGYTDDTITHHGVVQDGAAFLQKPFSPFALVQKVRLVLDGAATKTGPSSTSNSQ